jgi:tripeptidyl-peptidase I
MNLIIIALLLNLFSVTSLPITQNDSSWLETNTRSPSSLLLPIQIAVKYDSDKVQKLENIFWEVSNPTSSSYSNYLNKEQVDELLTPRNESTIEILEWLKSQSGISSVSLSTRGDWIYGFATIQALEFISGCDFVIYKSTTDSSIAHRCKGVRTNTKSNSLAGMPHYIAEKVAFIHPTNFLSAASRKVHSKRTSLLSNSAGSVTPATIRAAYKIGSVEGKASKNKQTAGGFLDEFADPADLANFYKQLYTPAIGRTIHYVGPNNSTKPGVEALLDVEYITAIGANINTTFHYTPGGYDNNNNEPYTQFNMELLGLSDEDLPLVVSMSYSDNENTVPLDFLQLADIGFMALGARGVSVLGSSGDGGVSGSQGGSCTTFVPTWPASSIYITSVGATQGTPEIAAGFSTGGFSNVYSIPSYQKSAVSHYFSIAKNLPPANVYNHTSRGFPDVSAFGVNFQIVCSGSTFAVDGTSCSCPTFAGIVSLLNDARLVAGKKSLGYLNQFLYTTAASSMTDVTQGNNPGCNSNGFYAAPEWDPITGLGTPVYTTLLALVMKLP